MIGWLFFYHGCGFFIEQQHKLQGFGWSGQFKFWHVSWVAQYTGQCVSGYNSVNDTRLLESLNSYKPVACALVAACEMAFISEGFEWI